MGADAKIRVFYLYTSRTIYKSEEPHNLNTKHTIIDTPTFLKEKKRTKTKKTKTTHLAVSK